MLTHRAFNRVCDITPIMFQDPITTYIISIFYNSNLAKVIWPEKYGLAPVTPSGGTAIGLDTLSQNCRPSYRLYTSIEKPAHLVLVN
jgi:hypothetical protein